MTLAAMRKAIAPAAMAIIAVIAQWIATADLDMAELRTALAGLFVSVVVYFVPNDPPPGAVLADYRTTSRQH